MGAVDIDPEPVIVRDVVNDALELLDPVSRARIRSGTSPSTPSATGTGGRFGGSSRTC